ncbi:MAG: glycosyltransferase family 2 protein [Acidobacteriota bacterium]
MSQTGIVVVTHNSEPEIGPCLDAALATGAQVVVVDNASQDATLEEVLLRPAVRLIANPWNRGFAAAANQGIGAIDCACVLLLNPDAVLLGGLAALASACRQPGVAAAGGKLVDERGRPQTGFMVRRFPSALSLTFEMFGLNRLWPANPVNRRYRCLDLDAEVPAEVEQPAGAFLMVRRGVWQELGGFDESFHPLWFEDVDFLKRARDLGCRVLYVPAAAARHLGGRSVGRLPWERRRVYWYDSLLSYAARHFRPLSLGMTCAAAMLASVARMGEGILRVSPRPFWVYSRVFRLAGRRLILGRREERVFASAFSARQQSSGG